jgi:hypothetical protein
MTTPKSSMTTPSASSSRSRTPLSCRRHQTPTWGSSPRNSTGSRRRSARAAP